MIERSAKNLGLEVLAAINRRDLAPIRDLVSGDFVDHGAPGNLPPGPDGYVAILTFVTQVLQIRYEIHDVVADGDTVAIRATAFGVDAVAPRGIDPTGKPFAMKTAHFYRSRDGRLIEHWGIRDELDVLYQVGALEPSEFPLPPI